MCQKCWPAPCICQKPGKRQKTEPMPGTPEYEAYLAALQEKAADAIKNGNSVFGQVLAKFKIKK